jgi:hypothetical protein
MACGLRVLQPAQPVLAAATAFDSFVLTNTRSFPGFTIRRKPRCSSASSSALPAGTIDDRITAVRLPMTT